MPGRLARAGGLAAQPRTGALIICWSLPS